MEPKSNSVAHIGGTFIYSKDPSKLAEWYRKHLGIEYEFTKDYNAYYTSFYYNDISTGKKAYLAWSILENKNRPDHEDKMFCINYRINDLEELVTYLKSHDVEVKGIEEYPEGKFAWIYDLDGNYVELWEDTTLGQ